MEEKTNKQEISIEKFNFYQNSIIFSNLGVFLFELSIFLFFYNYTPLNGTYQKLGYILYFVFAVIIQIILNFIFGIILFFLKEYRKLSKLMLIISLIGLVILGVVIVYLNGWIF